MQILDTVRAAVRALDSKKGQEIEVIRITSVSSLGDYLVLCTGNSSTQVRALADEVEFRLSELQVEPDHIEGLSSGWILLDYQSVMVHIFTPQQREFYALSHLWRDGEQIDVAAWLQEEEH